MARTTSRNGQRCWTVTLALAALVSGAWYLPEMPGREIQSIDMPPSQWNGGGEEGITVFHTEQELHQALPAKEDQEVPAVNWDSMDLVRVRCRAVGYTTEGVPEARYGTVAYDSRLGGFKHFVFLYEPKPHRLWEFGINVSSVFSQKFRETWLVVPKGTHLKWGSGGMGFYDLVFGILTGLLLLLLVFRLQRQPPNSAVWDGSNQRELTASIPSR